MLLCSVIMITVNRAEPLDKKALMLAVRTSRWENNLPKKTDCKNTVINLETCHAKLNCCDRSTSCFSFKSGRCDVRNKENLQSLINSVLIVHCFCNNNWHFIMEIWLFKQNKMHQQLELSCLGATPFWSDGDFFNMNQHCVGFCFLLVIDSFFCSFLLSPHQATATGLFYQINSINVVYDYSSLVFSNNQRKAWIENDRFLSLRVTYDTMNKTHTAYKGI